MADWGSSNNTIYNFYNLLMILSFEVAKFWK